MNFAEGRGIADRYGLSREFDRAYHWIKPWWAFWISEARAVEMALAEWDIV